MADELGCLDLLVDDDFFIDFDPSIVTIPPLPEDFIQSSPDSANSWIGEIESQLMNDDNNDELHNFLDLDLQSIPEFLADIFVDYPTSDSGPVVDLATDKVSDEVIVAEKEPEDTDYSRKEKKSDASNDSGNESQDRAKVEGEIEGNDVAVAKKRTRRLRNRDAAVRSRERKKEYVNDLERKSKYLERECMRLGRTLDCFVAENHSLRLCLQKGSGNASMTKQESAVLLLESLLLGSLLWFLGGIICQFPHQPHNTKSCHLSEPGMVVLRGQGRNSIRPSNTGKTRRCNGSRPRMKHQILIVVS